MELVTILRELWRRRLLVVAGAVLALALGTVTAYHVSISPLKLQSRQFHVGLATAHVLLDTPDSQVVDLDPAGADALGSRANLLANLMASTPVRDLIAGYAGIPADRLLAVAPATTVQPVPSVLSERAAASAGSAGAYVITVRQEDVLPIIKIDAQAPDAARAERLAAAATQGLQKYLRSVAATQDIPAARRFKVTSLGPEVSGDAVRGRRRLYAVLVTLLTFGFVCAAVIVASGLARGWRQAAAVEAEMDDGPLRLAEHLTSREPTARRA